MDVDASGEDLDALIRRLRATLPATTGDPVMRLPRAATVRLSRSEARSLPFAADASGAVACGERGLWMRPVEVRARASPVVVPEVVTCALIEGHSGPHTTSPEHPWGGLCKSRVVLRRWETAATI